MTVRTVLDETARIAVFDALAETAWSDGVVTLPELAAARAAARALELPGASLARDASREGLADGRRTLAPAEREVAVAASAWMALVDGQERPAELAAVHRVSAQLGIDDARRRMLAELAARVRSSLSRSTSLAVEFEQLVRAAVVARPPASA